MTGYRRADAPRLIDWTGERCVPWSPDIQVVYEHFHRYLWAAQLVNGRRVLDIGSGEGFGAMILAGHADHVVGIDVDTQTVEHSKLNYESSNLEFHTGTAVDLSTFADSSFGAVVAFEIIEHVGKQKTVLAEVARVLSDDGLLVVSTPDRIVYSDVQKRRNPFHVHELTREQFLSLLGTQFAHVGLWGQRSISGSHLGAIGNPSVDAADAPDFFVRQEGEEWTVTGSPNPVYFVAVASNKPLPPIRSTSTLADCDLQILRATEREVAFRHADVDRLEDELGKERQSSRERAQRVASELEAAHHELAVTRSDLAAERKKLYVAHHEIGRRDDEMLNLQRDLDRALADIRAAAVKLDAERQLNQRAAESVTWQAFQRASGSLYGLIGEQSVAARAIRRSLLGTGRLLAKRSARDASTEEDDGIILAFPQYENPQVSLILPVYARADLTLACLRAIRHNTPPVTYELIVVDDAADSETKRLLRRIVGARVVRNTENLGYLRSVKRGADAAGGEWLVLCNNDTEVQAGWLQSMLSCTTSDKDVGIVTPKYIYPDGRLNEAGGIIWSDGTGVNFGRGDAPNGPAYEHRRETDYGSGAALMVDGELWRSVGGFDERFFPMYYEDTDLCFAARELGKKVIYDPEACVVHVEGATAGSDPTSGAKRFQEENRPKFVEKWRHRLDTEHVEPASGDIRRLATRHRGPHVLLVDYRVPSWDRDSGSLRMLGMINALRELNARITLLPDNPIPLEPYTRRLRRLGVEVLCGPFDPQVELASVCADVSTAILCRPTIASRWLDSIRDFAPRARVVYDTVDLHWLREARRCASTSRFVGAIDHSDLDHEALPAKVRALRELELAMVRATDATMVVTEAERKQIEIDVPGSEVIVLPNVHESADEVQPPSQRSGVLFIGGFAHPPNVDAALKLARDVMPHVWSERPDVHLVIAGGDVPAEVANLTSPQIDVAGWVPDLAPLLKKSRVMVAPITFGAGVKGKVTQCLAAGLPVVTTTIGAEGIHPGCLLVADDPIQLATAALALYRDDQLWTRLSQAGREFIDTECSPTQIKQCLTSLLEIKSDGIGRDTAGVL